MLVRIVSLAAFLAVAACSGGTTPPADGVKAEADPAVDAAQAAREARIKAVQEDVKRRQKERAEKLSDVAPDDGWRAPESVASPDACKGAEPPKAVDPGSLTAPKLPEGANPALSQVSLAAEQAPETYRARFETSAGDFVIEVKREWAPIGADRFYNLVKIGYFDGASFFRNIAGFMVQFGINPYPEVNAVWKDARLEDEPVRLRNHRGVVTFAKCGAPNCRSTQVFINHTANLNLDPMGFAGFGRVVEGMDVVDKLYACYGEGAPRGAGPRQDLVQAFGKAYLDAGWPKLDQVKRATIVE
jgi:peptidyl-prolyl cis-trans isomerase A (cyclophilin A)